MLGFYLFRAACTSCSASTFIASATLHLLQLLRMFLDDVRARWAGVFWSSWAALMLGRAACVGRADADVLRLGDPEGVGRLGRRGGGWPGVQPRTVRFSGGRGMDMGG